MSRIKMSRIKTVRRRFERLERRIVLAAIAFDSHATSLQTPQFDRIQPADIDGDGDWDVVAADNDGIAWYANDGIGNFSKARTVTTRQSRSYRIVDFDGDSDLDIVIPAFSNFHVYWNDGRGRFTEGETIGGKHLSTGTAFDLDTDGLLDVIVPTPSGIVWRRNLGDGNFAGSESIRINRPIQDLAVGDVDGDGIEEIVATAVDVDLFRNEIVHDIQILRIDPSDPHSVEQIDVHRSLLPAPGSFAFVTLVDVDNDSNLDIVSVLRSRANTGHDALWKTDTVWHRGAGDGTFAPSEPVFNSVDAVVTDVGGWKYFRNFELDIDGDGDIDVLQDAGAGSQLYRFSSETSDFESAEPLALRVGADDFFVDLTGDGLVDHVQALDNPRLGRNHDGNTFSSVNLLTPAKLVATDVTNDGLSDAVFVSYDRNQLVVISQTTSNDSRLSNTALQISEHCTIQDMSTVDFNGDGDVDIMVACDNSLDFEGGLFLYENVVEGLFSEPKKLSDGEFIANATGDIDADGDADIVVIESNGDVTDLIWLANDGGMVSDRSRIISIDDFHDGETTIHDMDGDGDEDVILMNNGQLRWIENLDAGDGWIQRDELFDADSVFGPTGQLFDWDGDTDLDFLTGNTIYLNDGNGLFRERVEVPVAAGNSLRMGDFDGDKSAEIVDLGSGQWYTYNGVSWTGPLDTGFGPLPEETVITDFDGDGDSDILSVGISLVWLEPRLLGDVNRDGVFNSSDLVAVFQRGEYEDELSNNSTFDDGDWNGDGEFTSRDFIVVFQHAIYSFAAYNRDSTPEVEEVEFFRNALDIDPDSPLRPLHYRNSSNG